MPHLGLANHISCWGAIRLPPMISQPTVPIFPIQTPFGFDSPVRELSKQGVKFEPSGLNLGVIDDVKGQFKAETFDFSGLVTLASEISMFSANKADESAWIVFLTFVSTISCAL